MKNILLVTILSWAIAPAAYGQSAWNRIPLTGAEAKIIPVARQPRFNLSLTATFPLGNVAAQNIPLSALQNAAFMPETMARLFETLGGEFFIGSPSGSTGQTIEMTGHTQAIPGFQFGVRTGGHLELRAAAQHFRSEWSGEFPVVLLPHQQEYPVQPKTLQGSVSTSVSGFVLGIESAFFVIGGNIRPYVSAGVRGQFPVQTDAGAEIAGIPLPLEIEPARASFSPFGGAGVRWHFWKNAFLDAGCSVGKWSDAHYRPAVVASAGWAF